MSCPYFWFSQFRTQTKLSFLVSVVLKNRRLVRDNQSLELLSNFSILSTYPSKKKLRSYAKKFMELMVWHIQTKQREQLKSTQNMDTINYPFVWPKLIFHWGNSSFIQCTKVLFVEHCSFLRTTSSNSLIFFLYFVLNSLILTVTIQAKRVYRKDSLSRSAKLEPVLEPDFSILFLEILWRCLVLPKNRNSLLRMYLRLN